MKISRLFYRLTLCLIPALLILGCGEVEEILKATSDKGYVQGRSCPVTRGMWVWNFIAVLDEPAQQEALLTASKEAGITELYVFIVTKNYKEYERGIKAFNSQFAKAGIKVWGLEGYRGYFSDDMGPTNLYAAADAMIAFNAGASPDEQFVGFQTDMEPQDSEGNFPASFHNGIPDSKLNPVAGGVWFASEAEDRAKLMEDWIAIHATLKAKLATPGLRLGAAMPSWTDEYYKEPVSVVYKGEKVGVMKAMMDIVDDYVIMSYNTDPSYVAARLEGELSYADTLPEDSRPKVFGGMETHEGAGFEVSYADTPLKAHRTSVLKDSDIIHAKVIGHSSYCGINLHDWLGWRALAP